MKKGIWIVGCFVLATLGASLAQDARSPARTISGSADEDAPPPAAQVFAAQFAEPVSAFRGPIPAPAFPAEPPWPTIVE